MTLSRSNPRAKSRWALLIAGVVALIVAISAGALAALPSPSQFELDKDATNDTKSDAVGYLASNLTATATTLNVCQQLSYTYGTPPNDVTLTYPAPVSGETILLRNERMTLTANPTTGNFGGNCVGTKMLYSVTRGANASAHKGGDNVTARISALREPSAAGKAGPDWNQVRSLALNDPTATCSTLGLVECAFIEDGIGPSIFIGGNTKDHIDIPSWQHTSGSSPDKAEILNAYAAKAVVPSGSTGANAGDQVLYFGMDRYAVDGSTDIGFWFFKNPVYACPANPQDDAAVEACDGVPAGSFAGTHAINDVLILGTFTQGGATSNVRVFKWVGTGGNSGLATLNGPEAAFGDCVPGSASANGCATVNNSTIEVWPSYTFKGDALAGWAPAGGFFEGGVNLTSIGLQGCFSSFLAETRSSPELTAVLKDFALGSFEACDSSLTTRPGAGDANGTLLTDSDTPANGLPDVSIGTGSVQVKDRASLKVTGVSTWTGNLKFFLCGPDDLAPSTGKPATCTAGGTQIGNAAGATINQDSGTAQMDGSRLILSDAATVTKVGKYCWRAFFDSGTSGVPDGTDASANECFEVKPVTPTLTTNATAAIELGGATVLTDTATLGGTANRPGSPVINPTTAGAAAGGTITFRLYGPNDATCANDPVYTSNAIAVNGNGTYGGTTAGVSFTPTATGTYRWVASYSGDAPNTNPKSGLCNDANETSVVVDAFIRLSPLEATNDLGVEDGDLHDIVATVKQDTGTGTFVNAPDGTVVTFSLLNNDGEAEFLLDANDDPITTCTTSNGQCTITIRGLKPGSVDIHATTTFSIGSVSVTRSTDGVGNNSEDANKIFVDAAIAISPNQDTNNINSEHVFTVTVTLLPLGTVVTEGPTITPSISPTPGEYDDTCDTPVETGTDTDVYTCTVTINHGSAATFTLNATLTVKLDGLAITRDTNPATGSIGAGPGGSGPATKIFVEGSLTWLKHDQDGELLAGATFEVCQTHYLDTSVSPHALVELVDDSEPPVADPICVTVVDNADSDDNDDTNDNYSGLDEDPDGGEFLMTGLELGTWTIRETAAPEGYAFDETFKQTVQLTLASPDGIATTAFVNTRLFKMIIITCNESTSQLVVSSVDLEGNVKDTISAVPSSWNVSEKDLCEVTDGAVYGGLDAGIYEPEVTIPKGFVPPVI